MNQPLFNPRPQSHNPLTLTPTPATSEQLDSIARGEPVEGASPQPSQDSPNLDASPAELAAQVADLALQVSTLANIINELLTREFSRQRADILASVGVAA